MQLPRVYLYQRDIHEGYCDCFTMTTYSRRFCEDAFTSIGLRSHAIVCEFGVNHQFIEDASRSFARFRRSTRGRWGGRGLIQTATPRSRCARAVSTSTLPAPPRLHHLSPTPLFRRFFFHDGSYFCFPPKMMNVIKNSNDKFLVNFDFMLE